MKNILESILDIIDGYSIRIRISIIEKMIGCGVIKETKDIRGILNFLKGGETKDEE